jgi:tRNA-2-methylthio-N6-dimethylallyladenosine synthase
MLAYLETFGCQANERDSETIQGILLQIGYNMTTDPGSADLIILNTCSIREKAEQKVFSLLGTFRKLKEAKPGLFIGLCGCMAQEQDTIQTLRSRHPYVDFVVGTQRLHRLPDLLRSLQDGGGFQSDIEETGEIIEALPTVRPFPFKALVNITYGCNNFCTYCIVPYVRGRERSRALEAVIAETRQRVSEGAVEIMYLGQNVNTYGKGTTDNFAKLLLETNDIEGLKRVRYMTSHPRDFSEEMIEAIANAPKVSRHFHLPAQSGSTEILKRMNRGYSRETYLDLVQKIRKRIPEAILTTDIIVGFPGETDADFQDTLSLMQEVGFDAAFTFMYSPRQGTPAAKMAEQIPLTIKKERLQKLMSLQSDISMKLHQAIQGQSYEVLAETYNNGILTGRTTGSQLVHFPGPQDGIGKLFAVKITEAQTYLLKGEIDE